MSNIKIIKRDGREKPFTTLRIEKAVENARDEIGVINDTLGIDVANLVEDYLEENNIECIGVEQVQDLVVETLLQEDAEVAKAYKIYREERERIRSSNSKTFRDIDDIFNQTSEEIINNANKAGDKLQTYRAMISDVACSNYADSKMIPKHILKEHGKSIYIHDKSYLPIPIFNCILVNWMDMLDNGFHMGSTFISSPQSITTAVALLSQIISHTTSNTYGGNTLGDLDIGLEKYIERSYNKHLDVAKLWVVSEKQEEYAWNRLEKEVYDAVQGFEYEITTLMNSRGRFCSTI